MNLNSTQETKRSVHALVGGPPRLAVVTTAAPPSANGQARVLGQIIAPEMFAPPIFLTDQMNIIEVDQAHNGRHFELSSAPVPVHHASLGKTGSQAEPWRGSGAQRHDQGP